MSNNRTLKQLLSARIKRALSLNTITGNIKPFVQIPLIGFIVLLHSVYVHAQPPQLDFDPNVFQIVVTPDSDLIGWYDAQKYGEDFTITTTNAPGVYACSTFCPQAALDAGAVYYKQFEVPGHGTVTVYYDANGNIVGTGQDLDGDGIGDGFDVDADGDGTPDSQDQFPFDASRWTDQVGTIPGSFNVSSTGAAAYSIPIEVPPGTAGIQPKLSLEYSSQSGNDLLGLGWSISGLSLIHRCQKTSTQDNVVQAVNLAATDRFCLDGQRLMLVSGTYGSGAAEYRTEIDGMSKITQSGVMGSGPAMFTVRTKAGEVMEYTAIAVQDTSAAPVWLLSKVSDIAGNYMLISYTVDPGLREYYPHEIKYTGNDVASVPTFNTVTFNYETRPDVREYYFAGYKFSRTKRLANITTGASTYTLQYAAHETAKASRLKDLMRCDQNNKCLPLTQFNWRESDANAGWVENNGYALPAAIIGSDGEKDLGARFVDVNGDGMVDLLHSGQATLGEGECLQWENHFPPFTDPPNFCLERESVFISYKAWLGSMNGWVNNNNYAPPHAFVNSDGHDFGVRFADINGDGYPDLLMRNNNSATAFAWINNGNGSQQGSVWSSNNNFGPPVNITVDGIDRGVRIAELNGDGKADLIYSLAWGANMDNYYKRAWISSTSGWVEQFTYVPPVIMWDRVDQHFETRSLIMDLNGDGLSDYLDLPDPFHDHSVYDKARLNSGFAWDISSDHHLLPPYFSYSSGDFQLKTTTQLVDINGDGLLDYVEDGIAKINTARKWEEDLRYMEFDVPPSTVTYDDDTYYTKRGIRYVDLNGDGLTDAVYSQEGETAKAWLNTGSGWSVNIPEYAPPTALVTPVGRDLGVRFLDINGDGLTDMVQGKKNSDGTETRRAWINQAKVPLLESITDGNGAVTSVEYKVLYDSAVYTKATNAQAPAERDVQGAIYAVSRIKTDNGIGGIISNNYQYEGLKLNVQGRGMLGFAKLTTTQEQSNIKTITHYRQEFPYIGLPWKVEEQKMNGQYISQVENTYSNLNTDASGSKFPYISQTVEKVHDFDSGDQLTEITTTSAYTGSDNGGNYGNPTSIVVNTVNKLNPAESFSKQVINKYLPADTSNWILGRLYHTEITDTIGSSGENSVHVSEFEYDSGTGMLNKEIIEPSNSDPGMRLVTIYQRDTFGNISKKTLCESDRSACTHDTAGFRTVTTRYDDKGRFPIEIENDLGHIENYDYESNYGNAIYHKGPNDLETHWYYDGFGRRIKEQRADGTITTISYQPCGSCATGAIYAVTSQSTGEAPATIYFDKLGREISRRATGFNGQSVYIDILYDELGRIKKVSEPFYENASTIYWTENFYDGLNRVTQINYPGGDLNNNGSNITLTKAINYDRFTTTSTDAKGRNKVEVKNAIGQTTSTTDAANKAEATTLEYRYDSRSNLKETQIQGHPETLVKIFYDLRGRKIRLEDPDMGIWTYHYNAYGELIEQIDGKGQKTTIQYDDLGRMAQRTDLVGSASPGISSWTYGNTPVSKNVGKLISEQGPNGTSKSYLYDYLGRLSQSTYNIDMQSFEVDQAYSSSTGRLETITYPGSNPADPRFTVKRIYNSHGYLHKVQSTNTTPTVYWEAEQMNARGQLEREKLANGVTTATHVFNAATGWLDSVVSDNSTAGIIQHMSYLYDEAGNLKSRKDNHLNQIKTETFTYDELDRLLTSQVRDNNNNTIGTDKVVTYDSNGFGNISTKTGIGTYSYGGYSTSDVCNGYNPAPGPHAITEISGSGAEAGYYCYDLNGNLVSGGGRTIEYSAFNIPTILNKGGERVTFTYGADRSRMRKVVSDIASGNEKSRSIYIGLGASGGKLYEKQTDVQSGDIKHLYFIYAGNSPVAAHEIKQNGASTTEKTEYYHYDHLGSVEAVTDETGNIVANQNHDAWGKRRNPDWTDNSSGGLSPITGNLGFTGHETLAEVGLVHMNGRIYDPALSRFLSADPHVQFVKDTQSFNRYSYVFNNPLRYADPTGYFSEDMAAFIQFGLGLFFINIGTPIMGAIGIALVQRSFNIANGNPANQGVVLNFSFQTGRVSRAKVYEVRPIQTGRATQVRARITTPIPEGDELVSELDFITVMWGIQQSVSSRTTQSAKGSDEQQYLQADKNGDAIPEGITDAVYDTELGLEMSEGKLTGEIVWGCDAGDMAQCKIAVQGFDKLVSKNSFLNIKNTLVVDTQSFEAHINFYSNSNTNNVGFWDPARKILMYNTHYGINSRVSMHEYGHALGLHHTDNRTKNFMSYYGVSSGRQDVSYQINGFQRYNLTRTYTPWYKRLFDF